MNKNVELCAVPSVDLWSEFEMSNYTSKPGGTPLFMELTSENLRKAIRYFIDNNKGESVRTVSKRAGFSHPQLYNFLSKKNDLSFEVMLKVVKAIGFEVHVFSEPFPKEEEE